MKIRYYLRGLGLGIFFTAFFFLLCGDSKQTMSDEMIKERAKELGMIENVVLADIGEEQTQGSQEATTDSEKEEATTIETDAEETPETESIEESAEEETVASTQEESTQEEVVSTEEETVTEASDEETESEETSEAVSTEETSTGESIRFVVNKGEGSDTVSKHLQEAGLVEDAHEFDRYLMQNGYDKKIGAGEHLIPVGAEWQEIAEILCH